MQLSSGEMLAYNSTVNDICCDVCGPSGDEILRNLVTFGGKLDDTIEPVLDGIV
jgi:hypothetical protein